MMNKVKRILLILLINLVIINVMASFNKVKADTAGPKFLGIVSLRSSGYGYSQLGSKVWKIANYDSESDTSADLNESIYCIKGGAGFGSSDMSTGGEPKISKYTQKFNIKDLESINEPYKSALPKGANYNSLMWLLDNLYIMPKVGTDNTTARNAFLKSKITDTYLYELVTDDDIDVVQQLAIWYFTNPDEADKWHFKVTNLMVNKIANIDNNYTSINDLPQYQGLEEDEPNGWDREDAIQALFKYYVDTAKANSSYVSKNYTTKPIELEKSNAKMQKIGNNYVAGPYKINELLTGIDYNISATYTDVVTTSKKLTPQLGTKNSDGSITATSQNLKQLVGKEFYLMVPTSEDIAGIKMNLSSSYKTRTAEYWSVENAPSTEQPVVLVQESPFSFDDNASLIVPQPFDLSLRKFITEVNGQAITNRVPDVDVTRLASGEVTTATYNHPKTPIKVTAGDIVTYTIRVYNEGSVDGYVEEITDYLPQQLELVTGDALNNEYGWTKDPSNSKIVRTAYLSKAKNASNKLDSFNGSDLKYKDVKIKCKVVSTNPMPTKITNIAEISKFTDGDGNSVKDRDSSAKNATIPTGTNLENYKDPEINRGEQYIPGQQDDDDFEKLIIKEFDLSLRKFITGLNNSPITNREPKVDVAKLKSGEAKTATYNHTKSPISVTIGDIVEYTIRVYNEGEVSGYVEEITDHLPQQLELITGDSVNTQYGWTADPANSKIVKTSYLSKAKDTSNKLLAFNGSDLKYKDVKIKCRVVSTNPMPTKITNIADITNFVNENGEKVKDRDSQEKNVDVPTGTNLENYKDTELNKSYIPGQQDDDDFEKLKLKEFDLSLRKFITKINDDNTTSRIPVVDVTQLKNGKSTTAKYTHSKTPIKLDIKDIVEYTIRVYNEGEVDGYAKQIKDHLPDQLEFLPDHETNKKYEWVVDETNNKVIKTNYLSKEKSTDNKIKAFDGTKLDYKDIKVACKVVKTKPMPKKVTNIADISDFTNGNGETIKDRDSQKDNVNMPPDLPGYKDDEISKDYVPGQQDDDDFEKVEIKEHIFDLALRKFITQVNEKPVTDRYPVFSKTDGKYQYNHTKEPVLVKTTDIVTYTIRVYNEGDLAGYAKQIKDDIPEGLEFLPDNGTNKEYRWTMLDKDGNTTTDVSKAKSIVTDYLSKDQEKTPNGNLLNVFKPETMSEPDHKEVRVAFRVTEPNSSDRIIINKAQISEDTDEDGDDVNDKDSTPDKWNEGEDDQDIEKIKVQEFDLSLRKFITGINNKEINDREPDVDVTQLKNGKSTTAKYTHPKTPIKLDIKDIVEYTIRVYNEGEIDGYAKQIKDHLPDQLEFLPDHETNKKYEWAVDETNNKVIKTNYLSKEKSTDNKIKAFNGTKLDYKDVKVVCKVVKTKPMPKKVTNIADISDFTNENGEAIKDRDSQKDNVNMPPDLPGYKDDEISKDYVPGQQDDDDFEKVEIKEHIFDLALRKFITQVNEKPVTDRYPVFSKKDGKYQYNHTKEPVPVKTTDIVTYTIRVYNEGDLAGYAKQIKDDIPEGLEFLPDNGTNKEYRWTMLDKDGNTTTDVSKAKSIVTDYLSKDQEKTPNGNLLNVFKPETMSEPDHKEVRVAFRVTEPNSSDRIIINKAQISEDTDEDGDDVNDKDSTPDKWNEGEDDQDIEKIKVQEFDLALRKFITGVNSREIEDREPQVDVSKLKNETAKTATYNHPKDPVLVAQGNLVTYTIRVYNEGEISGYAKQVKDDMPKGIKFLADHETNKEYRWKMLDEEGNETENLEEAVSIVTDYLSKDQEKTAGENLIKAFNKETGKIDYKDVKVVFEVTEPNSSDRIIINKAQISEDTDENGKDIDDRDSTPDEWNEGEDDQDIEKIKVQEFDLALRKFITGVNNTEIKDREPQVDVTKLASGEAKTATYNHPKDPVLVTNGNIVTYTIRVYNEGEISGYAKQVKDDMPEGIKFLVDHETNKKYRWKMLDKDGQETENLEEAVSIVTDYLSKDQEKIPGENLIKAFNPETKEISYKDVKVAFEVTEPAKSDRIIINKAEISEDTDEHGDDVHDRDSTPDKWNEGEDDQDIEKIKVQYFDLSLRKWVTQAIVTENGEDKIIETGHAAEDDPEDVVKVDLKKSKIDKVTVKFRYKVRVKNEGTIAGYAKELKDYIPEGLKFVAEDNPLWKQEDENTITTDQTKDILLQPGDTTEVEVLLTWINNSENFGVKDNWAEISKDFNDYGAPDIDSTPNNNKKGEDDIDDAPVMLAVQTGQIIIYGTITLAVLLIISSGLILIKKYVL